MLNRRNLFFTGAAIALLPNLVFAQENWNQKINQNIRIIGEPNSINSIKKVVIGSFVLQFQINSTDIKGGNLLNANTTKSTLYWNNADYNMLSNIADAALIDLKKRFKEKGIEVIDESELKKVKAYQDLIKGAGYDSGRSQFGNADGTILYIAPRNLQPIQSYNIEEGAFVTNYQSNKSILKYIKEGSGGSPSPIRGSFWQGPGLEIEIAKALGVDAFVKVNYIVNFAKIDGKSSIDRTSYDTFGDENVKTNVETSITELVRIRQDQSRISFRLAESTKKMGYKVDLLKRKDFDPARDGDIVINLKEPINIGTNLFSFSEIKDNTKNVGLNNLAIIGRVKGQFELEQTATLNKPDIYSSQLLGAIKSMQKAMILNNWCYKFFPKTSPAK